MKLVYEENCQTRYKRRACKERLIVSGKDSRKSGFAAVLRQLSSTKLASTNADD